MKRRKRKLRGLLNNNLKVYVGKNKLDCEKKGAEGGVVFYYQISFSQWTNQIVPIAVLLKSYSHSYFVLFFVDEIKFLTVDHTSILLQML